MRLDAMGFGNVLVDDVKQQTALLLSEAVAHYLQLTGIGKAKTFHQAALRIKANVSSCFAFPRYTDKPHCHDNSASNALN